jgi:hypothetical protein
MTSEERRERKKQLGRKYYENRTPEQREKRKIYQRDYMRQRRTKLKATKSPLQPVSEVSAPVTLPKPQIAPQAKPARSTRSQDLVSYDGLSSQKARVLQKVWRSEVSDYLLDAITRPDSPLSGAGLRASKMLCFWFKLSEKLDRIVEADSDKPDSQHEMTLAVMLECLRRLTGEGKTAAAPALPGIAQKPALAARLSLKE